jgi:17beta-estradiol 17-dehydrogenase / very-long-chain 3-oxoacyl-CoA reductase
MLKRQKRSAIINLSSVAGEHPLPYLAIYSSTKAFNDYFSQSI